MNLSEHIRPIPDFPKPGILFRDITPLLAHPEALKEAIQQIAAPWQGVNIHAVAAVEARGFLFATPLAIALGVGVIPVRKPGKLPADTISYDYELEYGHDTLEMHRGILAQGSNVLIVDDVLATGGTAQACIKLVESAGARVAGAAFLVELDALGGRELLVPHRVESVVRY